MTAFSAQCADAARRLHAAHPLGFGLADFARELGCQEADARLYKWLYRQDTTNAFLNWFGKQKFDGSAFVDLSERYQDHSSKKPVVYAVDDDVFKLVNPDDDEAGLLIADKLRLYAERCGGIFAVGDAVKALNLDGGNGKRRVSSILAEADEYVRMLPYPGSQRLWSLRPTIRRRIAVPGHLQILDIRIEHADSGDEGSFLERFDNRFINIGAAIRSARLNAPANAAELDAIFERDLAACKTRLEVGGGDVGTVKQWWRQLLDGSDYDEALATAWARLELGGAPQLALALSMDFWTVFERHTGVSASATSRGRKPE